MEEFFQSLKAIEGKTISSCKMGPVGYHINIEERGNRQIRGGSDPAFSIISSSDIRFKDFENSPEVQVIKTCLFDGMMDEKTSPVRLVIERAKYDKNDGALYLLINGLVGIGIYTHGSCKNSEEDVWSFYDCRERKRILVFLGGTDGVATIVSVGG